jgi:hypothetical protein
VSCVVARPHMKAWAAEGAPSHSLLESPLERPARPALARGRRRGGLLGRSEERTSSTEDAERLAEEALAGVACSGAGCMALVAEEEAITRMC